MCTAPIPALAPVIRTVLPSNLSALKMDIDEQEAIEFDDQMDNAVMFAGGISVDSRELTTRLAGSVTLLSRLLSKVE
jgi:hypothetical protein